MPLHQHVTVEKGGIHGYCWWATDDIPANAVVWRYGDKDKGISKYVQRYTIEQVQSWPKKDIDEFMSLAYQVEDNLLDGFIPGVEIPWDVIKENYVNHCCDGNTWYLDDDTLIAKRDIKKGEEITYDYALTECSPDWSINCLCGKDACRKHVSGDDWKRRPQQEATIMPLHQHVTVEKGGIHGYCWWATDDIPANAVVWRYGDKDKGISKYVQRYTIEQVQSWPKKDIDEFMSLAYQVEDNLLDGFIPGVEIPWDVIKENYVNHCCDGNTWYLDDDTLIAKRDIKKGEEITYDYALTECSPDWSINCLCGKDACRKHVSGDDWKKPEIQAMYKGHFLKYINDKINKK
eukprot:TRINITY_DN284_c0_g1_i1.p2 TRINITY_DN284_c0_g1~~TRINITY_DN284_c0_g1_i1.p2  ORF type:complete len:363 (+),score=128.16 TRINITY_DN284_c0_g1_i1:50-1090(+)